MGLLAKGLGERKGSYDWRILHKSIKSDEMEMAQQATKTTMILLGRDYMIAAGGYETTYNKNFWKPRVCYMALICSRPFVRSLS